MKDMWPELKCTGQVFRYDIFARKATTDTNLVETYSGCCSLTKNRRGILACLTLFAKVASETGKT